MFGTVTYSLEESETGGSRLVLSGQMLVSSVGPFEAEIDAQPHEFAEIDISGVDEMDTTGAWVVSRLAAHHTCAITGASDTAKHLLEAVEVAGGDGELCPPVVPVWERVPLALGEQVYAARGGIFGVVSFLGAILIGFGTMIRRPSKIPVRAVVRQMGDGGGLGPPNHWPYELPHRHCDLLSRARCNCRNLALRL